MACCQYRQRNSKQMWAPSSLYGNNQFLPIEVVLLPYMYTWPPARHKITCTNRCGRPPPYKGIIELIQCLSFFLPYMGIWHSAREYHVSKQMWAPSPKISIPIISSQLLLCINGTYDLNIFKHFFCENWKCFEIMKYLYF